MKQILKIFSFFLFLVCAQVRVLMCAQIDPGNFCHKETLDFLVADEQIFSSISLAVNDNCQAVAGWSKTVGSESPLGSFVAIWNGSPPWGDTEQLMSPSFSETARSVSVAINNKGKAVAVW